MLRLLHSSLVICALSILLTPAAPAGVAIDFQITFDGSLTESDDYLSNLCIIYYANEPGNPYTFIDAVSYLNPQYATIPVNDLTGFSTRIVDSIVSDPAHLVNYAVIGTYNDVDTGSGPSFFCSFFDPTVAEGRTFDDIFAGPEWNAIVDPYTEAEVLAALADPLGWSNPDNGLVINYLSSFILFDATGIATPFTNPGVDPQSNTLYHFSTATRFASGTATVSTLNVIPEPSTGLLALLGLAGLSLTHARIRSHRAD